MKSSLTLPILCLLLLLSSCKKTVENTDLPAPTNYDNTWKQKIPQYFATLKIFTNATVSENELRLASTESFFRFDRNSQVIEGAYSLHVSTAPSIKSAFSHNLFAALSFTSTYLKIANCQIPHADGTALYLSLNANAPLYLQKYSKFNVSSHVGAFNQSNQFTTSVLLKNDPTKICLLQVRVNPINTYHTWLVPDSEQEILLPAEPTTKVYNMEAFYNNFFISTTENAYMVRPDGSYKKIFSQRVWDYFQWKGKLYADLGNQLHESIDDGESWILAQNNLNLPAPREFATIQDELICYKDDSLFHINAQNFACQKIQNKGLATNKITAVSSFMDSVYVTTWNGLYAKSKQGFFNDK